MLLHWFSFIKLCKWIKLLTYYPNLVNNPAIIGPDCKSSLKKTNRLLINCTEYLFTRSLKMSGFWDSNSNKSFRSNILKIKYFKWIIYGIWKNPCFNCLHDSWFHDAHLDERWGPHYKIIVDRGWIFYCQLTP